MLNTNTNTKCSKSTIKTAERSHWCRYGVFNVKSEYISHPVLVFLLLTLSRYMPLGNALQEIIHAPITRAYNLLLL